MCRDGLPPAQAPRGRVAPTGGTRRPYHYTVGVNWCVIVCVGATFQGGNLYLQWGATGYSPAPSLNLGYANRRAEDRCSSAIGGGGGVLVGGYATMGSDGSDAHPNDWEMGISVVPMGGWIGISRTVLQPP